MAAVTARTAIASQSVSPGQTPSFCTATSSILALISFDDAPYDGVTYDVGCAEANSGNTVYTFQLRHGVCQPRCAGHGKIDLPGIARSEEHTSELQSLMRISYAVFCLKKKKKNRQRTNIH